MQDSHGYLLGDETEADDFVAPAELYGGFAESLAFVVAPGRMANVFVEDDHRSRDDPSCQTFEDGLRRSIEIAIDVDESHRAALFPEEARDGFLETTPGRSIEYEFVAEYLRKVFDRCDVQCINFDRYNMRFLKPWLERVGFTEEEIGRFKEFGQGFVSMSPALRETESLLLNNKFRHGKHPVLTMCASNAVIATDPAGNRKFAKDKASGRIDGMVALAMAVGVMPNAAGGEKSFWEAA